jgi:lipopolysaccharide export system permease protein
MPILWNYLLKGYFQLFFLCVSAFVSVLLVVRFQEIALFASSGANLYQIALFSFYQIPYILPLAIPISCLLAAMILFQKMSTHLEITALRASGLSLGSLCYPLLLAGCLLSLVNFTVTSEMTPLTRTLAKNLLYQIAGDNPLIVMQKDSAFALKTFDFDLKNLQPGKKAEEVIGIMRQESQDRIALFTVKELSIDKEWIHGSNLSFISNVDPKFPGYDHLIIENQQSMQVSKPTITSHLFSTEWFAKDDLLTLKEALHKYRKEKLSLTSKTGIDLIRRVYLGLCPFTFTVIGLAFGINTSRQKRKEAFFWTFSLSILMLGSFIASKTLYKISFLAILLYIVPHPFALLVSLRSLRGISKGESSC